MGKQPIAEKEAVHGQKMVEVKLRFWTNDIAEQKGNIVPRHAWSSGVVRIEPNKCHGIEGSDSIPFNSLLEAGKAIEQCLLRSR